MERRGQRSIPHISALDGARGAAVAGVLLFHGGHLTGGYLGVDFFFTLSGFLITSLLLAEVARHNSVGLGAFWARRARRLLPALVVLMLGVAVYSRVIATPQELPQIRGDALATLAYSANWRSVFAHQSYFALFLSPSPLQHTWSLAIEEQFYLVWPLVFVALFAAFSRATAKAVLVTSLVLAAASVLLTVVLYDARNTNRDYYGTDTRAAAILFGVALAAGLALYGPVKRRGTRHRARSARRRGRALPRDRLDTARRRITPPLSRRLRGVRGGRHDHHRRGGASRTRTDRARPVVAAARRARPHQLRRVSVPLAARPHPRRTTRAPLGLAAVRGPNPGHPRGCNRLVPVHRATDPPRRDPRVAVARTRSGRRGRPVDDPRRHHHHLGRVASQPAGRRPGERRASRVRRARRRARRASSLSGTPSRTSSRATASAGSGRGTNRGSTCSTAASPAATTHLSSRASR